MPKPSDEVHLQQISELLGKKLKAKIGVLLVLNLVVAGYSRKRLPELPGLTVER